MAFEHRYRYIDPVLVERIGAPDAAVERAIEAEVLDAVEGVVGDLVPDVRSRPEVVDRIAPWARDLGAACSGMRSTAPTRSAPRRCSNGSLGETSTRGKKIDSPKPWILRGRSPTTG